MPLEMMSSPPAVALCRESCNFCFHLDSTMCVSDDPSPVAEGKIEGSRSPMGVSEMEGPHGGRAALDEERRRGSLPGPPPTLPPPQLNGHLLPPHLQHQLHLQHLQPHLQHLQHLQHLSVHRRHAEEETGEPSKLARGSRAFISHTDPLSTAPVLSVDKLTFCVGYRYVQFPNVCFFVRRNHAAG